MHMSKKMMKRSLALGALMAFVITGNALAADITIATSSDIGSVGTDWNTTNDFYHTIDKTGNDITVGSASADFGVNIYGAYDTNGDVVNSNTITLNGGKLKKVYGGYTNFNSGSVVANGNTINIKNSISGNSYIYGGYAWTYNNQINEYKAEASNNKIIVDCVGDLSNYFKVSDVLNQYGKAVANNNSIEISSGAVMKKALWATSVQGNDVEASGNSIIVNGTLDLGSSGIIVADIGFELKSTNGEIDGKANVQNNSVEINGAVNTSGDIYATRFSYNGNGTHDYRVNINVSGNKVDIKGNGSVDDVYGAYVEAKSTEITSTIENNVVNITGDIEVNGKNIYGAYVKNIVDYYGSQDASGDAVASVNGNTVNIGGDVTVNEDCVIYGGYVESIGETQGKTEQPVVDQNTGNVSITVKEVTSNVNNSYTANAEGNTVNIGGNAIVKGKVYGGYAKSFKDDNGYNVASGNTINISDNADISGAVLEGSKTDTYELMTETTNGTVSGNNFTPDTVQPEPTGGNKDTSDENTSNNTLNISKDWTGGANGNKEVKSLGNFDEIVIEEMKYGETALTVTEKLEYKKDIDGNDNSNGTKITVKRVNMSGNEDLGDGVNLNIIEMGDNATKQGAVADGSSATIYKGTSEIIDVTFNNSDMTGTNGGIQVDENNITKKTRNDQVLVIGESRAAATAFVNQGSEIIETGLDALARDNSKAGDTKVFAAVYGNASEYATGSHVKVNGWSGIVGVGKTNANGLTVGAFFENGEGNYRTYNTVNNEFMRGDGEANYNGGGFLVRKDNPNGVYTEASLRAGNLQNELRKAVRGSEGLAGYDVDTFYYGAHVGVGKIIPRGNEGDSIDVYGKFIYTHHDSESFDIDGSDFHFDSVDSERLRLGFRINEVQTNKLSMYYGAAWEYEFGGDADNTTVGYDLSTPSLGGSTVIGEIGMHYLASEKWSLDFNVRGYSGQRDGFTGSVQANYAF